MNIRNTVYYTTNYEIFDRDKVFRRNYFLNHIIKELPYANNNDIIKLCTVHTFNSNFDYQFRSDTAKEYIKHNEHHDFIVRLNKEIEEENKRITEYNIKVDEEKRKNPKLKKTT